MKVGGMTEVEALNNLLDGANAKILELDRKLWDSNTGSELDVRNPDVVPDPYEDDAKPKVRPQHERETLESY